MEKSCRILLSPAEGYYEEKKSRFLSLAAPVESEEEVQSLLAQRRRLYWDARHHCYAFLIGGPAGSSRFSDDGEPGGTAGKPIRDVLEGSGIQNICIVVTRYFGGTLLGTGGLVRAYSAAAKDALLHAETALCIRGEEWQLICDYSDKARIDRLLAEQNIEKLSEEFSQDVTMHLFLEEEMIPLFQSCVADLTAGSALLEKIGERNHIRRESFTD
ncbi:MAG: YigZ family protein [Lachnospiraceae bacterium]|nr:YigZ family protein [Lachnospiraceae bacterium]